jgi:hypothetical protein
MNSLTNKNSVFLSTIFVGLSIFVLFVVNGNGQKKLINRCESEDLSVNVSIVQPVNSVDDKLYLIKYSYEFKNRDTIFLRNIGELPSKGKFEHIYEGGTLEFLTNKNGETLCKVELKPNKPAAVGGADDTPPDSAFGSLKASPTSAANNSQFFERVTNLLNQKNFTYRISNRDGVVTVTSNYRSLDGMPSNLRGEMAVQITFPQQNNGNQFSFYIYYHARQKPRRSESWTDLEAGNRGIADDFVNDLINGLR